MRAIILDRAHDPGLGHPVYADDRPELHDEPVWAVADIQEDASGEDWSFDYLAEGITYAQALEWMGAGSIP